MTAPHQERAVRTRAGFELWVANGVAATLIATSWLAHALPATSAMGFVFPRLALVASVAILSLPPLLVGWFLGLLVRREAPLGWLRALVWTGFLAFVWFDTRVFEMFRYHVNGLVWDTIRHDGGDAVTITLRDQLVVGSVLVLTLCAERALHHWRAARALARRAEGRLAPWWLRARPVWTLLLAVLVAEKGMYAWGDIRRDRSVTSVARLFPLYQRLTIKGFVSRAFGVDFEELPEVRLRGDSRVLRYPRAEVHAPADGPRPNVLIAVVDSLRADVVAPEVMPRLSAWAAGARRFEDHLSTGNATRFGLFGLAFGVHGIYWQPFYEDKVSSVLVDVLVERGYDFGIFATAKLSSPAELRSTAFVRVEGSVHDELKRGGLGKAGGDRECADRLLAWLDERATDAPWFGFVMLDSPHQPYDFPREDPPFQPYLDKLDYLSHDAEFPPEYRALLWNTYRNAVHHADDVLGALLDGLAERGLADDTLVFVTGDHGEEFGEFGFFGHTSNFAAGQSRVPFLVRGPGFAPGVEPRPTSHVDVVPTVLEALGVDPALRDDYSNGQNLRAPADARVRVVSGWEELGMWTASGIFVVPFEGYRGATTVYDDRWRLVLDDATILRAHAGDLATLARECARFLR